MKWLIRKLLGGYLKREYDAGFRQGYEEGIVVGILDEKVRAYAELTREGKGL